MKRICKDKAPQWFEDWKKDFEAENHKIPHYKEDFASNDVDGRERRRRLRKYLIREQGKICCYCMRRISVESSHNEHFWPKKYFMDIDLSYENLLASCNGENVIREDEEHCGHRKEDWWREDMVSPTDMEIEKMFRYRVDGSIESVKGRETSNIAQEMIHNFGLDSFHLERERRQAIEASEVCDEEEYSDEDIRTFIEYYSNMDNGQYVPFCGAIIDCLEAML